MQEYAAWRRRVVMMVVRTNGIVLFVMVFVMATTTMTAPRPSTVAPISSSSSTSLHHCRLFQEEEEEEEPQQLKNLLLQQRSNTTTSLWNEANAKLMCRIIVLETLREREKSDELDDDDDDETRIFIEEELACIPINDDGQEDPNQHGALSFSESLQEILPLDSWKRHEHSHDHHEGMMYVSLSGVVVVPQSRTVDVATNKEAVQVTLVKPPAQQSQSNYQQQQPQTGRELYSGSMSLAMIRVSTRDAQIATSALEMEQYAFNGAATNMISQYQAMSFGKLQIIPVGVYDVFIDNDIFNYKGGVEMYGDIEAAMVQQLGLNAATDLADRVFFCVPGGTQKGFIAFTYKGSWRATFSGDWCTSLSATVHEFAHIIGLGHSHIVTPDHSDGSCYMSMSTKLSSTPRQAFNGAKNWLLNWYNTRHLSIDSLSLQQGQPQIVYLAAFVDFQKTTENQPVIVALGDRYFIQYNRAKGFNAETRQAQNQVTVTEMIDTSNSEQKAALDLNEPVYIIANYLGSGRSLYIQVCHEIIQDDENSELPDIMALNIGFSQVDCQEAIRESSLYMEIQQQQSSAALSNSSPPIPEPYGPSLSSSSPATYTVDPMGSSPSMYPTVWEPTFSPTDIPSADIIPSDAPQQAWSSIPSLEPSPGDASDFNVNANMDQPESTFTTRSSSSACVPWRIRCASLFSIVLLYHISMIM